MTLPISYITIAAAVFPIFVLLMLLIFKWEASEAAPVAALLSLFISVGAFKSSAMLIAIEGSKGVWNAMLVIYALWAGCLLYQILKHAAFAKRVYKAEYHKTDLAKEMEEQKKEDMKAVTMPEGGISFAVYVLLVLIFMLCAPLSAKLGIFGFNFPENATGYGYVNQAMTGYAPLGAMLHAASVLILIDFVGMIVLAAKHRLKAGDLRKIVKKSFVLAFPTGITVSAILLMLAVMNGTGQIYVLTVGSLREFNMSAVGILVAILAPLGIWLDEKRRTAKMKADEEEAAKAAKQGKKMIRHKAKFYETREGALTLAFVVEFVAFIFMMIGIWGSDQTFVLDGFALIVTAMLFCPMRSFIFEKVKYFI